MTINELFSFSDQYWDDQYWDDQYWDELSDGIDLADEVDDDNGY